MDEQPKRAIIGELEFTQMQADELLTMFRGPGWQHMIRILDNHRKVDVETVFGAHEKTQAQYAVVHGMYGMVEAILDLPRKADEAYAESFLQK